jgi:hypothetical protein
MGQAFPSRIASQSQLRDVGFPALASILIAAMPKCPLCWMALMSALGLGTTIRWQWLQPLAGAVLFLSVTGLFWRARRRRIYGPLCLGLVAACFIYFCKFKLNYDPGVYLGSAALLGATLWNALPPHQVADKTHCHC